MWVSKEEVEDYGFFASWYSLFLLFFSFLTSFWDLSFIVVDNMLCIVLGFFFEGGYYNSVLLCMGWI
jgi:hypothetical protein